MALMSVVACATDDVDSGYDYGDDEPYVHGALQVLEDADFPYDLDGDIELTVDITTTNRTAMNNRKLGINSTLQDAYVSSSGYDAQNSKDFITWYQPSVMRFPNGVYGNFYKWDEDNRYLPSDTQPTWDYGDHASAGEQNHITLGISSLVEMQKSLGYDIQWIWCMNHVDATMVNRLGTDEEFYSKRDDESFMMFEDADGKQYSFYEAVAHETEVRYKYYTETLFTNVDLVELGNEPFFKTQQSAMASECAYASYSSYDGPENLDMKLVETIAKKLKELNPSIKLAMPFSWRRGDGNSVSVDTRNHYKFNLQYIDGELENHYDAMVLHKYVKPEGFSEDNMKSLLEVKRDYQADFEYYQAMNPGKEVWLTEWSIGVAASTTDDDPGTDDGDDDTGDVSADSSNAVSVLSLVDLYFYLFSEPLFSSVEYFQAHGTANPFFVDSGTSSAMVLTKTGFGAAFEILKGMFTSSTVLGTQLEGAPVLHDVSTQQWQGASNISTLDPVYGVSAMSVQQEDGHYALLLVNKTNREASLKIKFDGEEYTEDYIYEYLSFDSLREVKTWSQTADVLTMNPYQAGDLILKPYSITKISEFRIDGAPDSTY